MAGQGKTTMELAAMLASAGWQIAYTCIPNNPHVGAVAIPTGRGTSRQRYPDIVACRDDVLALVEVEIAISESVVADITERFQEMVVALDDAGVYEIWRRAVERQCGVLPPDPRRIACVLVLCRSISAEKKMLQRALGERGIQSMVSGDFDPSGLVPPT